VRVTKAALEALLKIEQQKVKALEERIGIPTWDMERRLEDTQIANDLLTLELQKERQKRAEIHYLETIKTVAVESPKLRRTANRLWVALTAAVVALLLTACSGFEPSGAQPFTPPLSYRQEYAVAKECSEVPAKWARPFEAFRFWAVPDPFLAEDGTPLAGLRNENNIYIHEMYLDRAWIVRHEMIHSFGYGDDPHPAVFTRCLAMWGAHDTLRLAL
jgi:hypothetical protein